MIIDKFLERYSKEYDFYLNVAQTCSNLCENKLENNGIRAIVSYRAKRIDRLKGKLIKRNEEKKYKTVESIYKDIVDLSGVRIALYFPGDRDSVDKFIYSNFDVVDKKTFPNISEQSPYKKRFSGYWANHYRIYLKPQNLSEENKRFSQTIVEIQVASILMHAWSEVEHDLVYKPLKGKLSDDELAILDQINGLVLAGEIALERLQKSLMAKIELFNNHYDLSSYLLKMLKPVFDKENIEPIMGRVDILHKFLEEINMNSPISLNEIIMDLDTNTEKRPIVDQIFDRIAVGKIEYYNLYKEIKDEIELKSFNKSKPKKATFSELGFFMYSWATFESVARLIYQDKNKEKYIGNYLFTPQYLNTLNVDDNIIGEISYIRKIRNEVVHGVEIPDNGMLISLGKTLKEIVIKLADCDLSPQIEEKVKSLIDEMIEFID